MPKPPLSSRIVRASLAAFQRSNILWAAFAICTYGALYTGMLLSLGMNQKQIGLIMSVPLLTLPVQIAGAVLQQRYFNRKRFWVGALGFYLLMFALMAVLVAAWPTLPPGGAMGLFIALLLLANVGFQLHRPVQLAWQSDIVPEREVSVFWNRLTAQGMVASVVAGFAMGWVADRLGRENRLTYVLLLSIGLVFAVASLRTNARVPDPDPDPRAEGGVLSDIREVLGSASFQRLSAVFSLQSVAAWLCSAFIFVHLQRTMKFTMFQMQVLAGISCVVSFAAGRLFEIVGKRYGRKPILLICTLVKSVEFVLWGMMRPGDHLLDLAVRRASIALLGDWAALPEGFASAIPVFVLGGFVNVGIASMQLAFMRSIGTRKTQTLAISLFFSVSGIVGGIVAMFSGALFDLLASPDVGPAGLRRLVGGWGLTPFNVLAFASAALYALTGLLVRLLREEGAAPTMHVVKVLFASNPVRGVYQAQTLSNALTEAARLDVLRTAKGGLVESELVRALQSCSSQVRDGAVRNLAGQGGDMDPNVAAALLDVLQMPDLGIQIEAAKALGRSGHKPALPHLAALFDNDDANLAAACIGAVGLMGDRAALPDVRAVLEAEDAPPILMAQAAEAASRLGDHKEARLVFGAFTVNTNAVLQTQCLVSICRAMEDGPHVHQVFEDEALKPGARAAALCVSLGRRWQGLDVDAMVAHLDAGRFQEVATSALCAELAFCLPCEPPTDISETDFLKDFFAENGQFKDERLEGPDYVATSLWLQLRLWAYLAYGAGEQDRFVLLSVLFLADRLSKRLDPKHPRYRPPAKSSATPENGGRSSF
ncbi:MAG: MFS transporter [Kiritimatiellia bacterium]|jgi:MFS family permease